MKMKHTKHITILSTFALAAAVVAILSAGKSHNIKMRTPQVKSKRSRIVRKKKQKKNIIVQTNIKTISKAATPPKAKKPVIKNTLVKQASSNDEMKEILNSTTGLKANVLQLGLNAYHWAKHQGRVKNPYLTIIDFSILSKNDRMWVIDMRTDKVILKTLVANGKYSGLYKGTQFSNRSGSKESSLGVYITGTPYYGNDGLSLHVRGIQPGINSNAYRRLIEFHGANYVSPSFAKAYGRVGRSWGCFALDKAILPKVIHTIKEGSVVFAYANGHSSAYRPYAG